VVPVLVLLAAAVPLVALSAATARRPEGAIPDRDGYLDRWAALHGGYDPRGNTALRWWLLIAYRVGRPLAGLGVRPNALTVWGVWLAGAVLPPAIAGGRWLLLAGVLVVLSGLGDTLDGCVAALTGRSSRLGYVLDSLVDRVTDALYLVALWVVGGSAWLAVVTGALAYLLEYTRARAGNAGVGEVGVVTVGERGTRVILVALALVAGGVLVEHAALMATLGLAASAAVGLVALGQLLAYLARRLRDGA
jgi:archaetidylinositol phosphate synthase